MYRLLIQSEDVRCYKRMPASPPASHILTVQCCCCPVGFYAVTPPSHLAFALRTVILLFDPARNVELRNVSVLFKLSIHIVTSVT